MARSDANSYAKRVMAIYALFKTNKATEEDTRSAIAELFDDYLDERLNRRVRVKPENEGTNSVEQLASWLKAGKYADAEKILDDVISDIKISYIIKYLIDELKDKEIDVPGFSSEETPS